MQENINYSNPDDGFGDKLRNAFIKIQNNFTELYNGKVDKVAGKGLSENDFTDADKTKLYGIEDGAQVNVNADFGENDPFAYGYILNRPPAMYASVGYFDYNDLATHTTPLVLVSGVNKKLTNDTLGVFTDLSQAPYGVPRIWNSTLNQFEFSTLSIGDTLDMRVDCLLTTTGTNKTYKIFLKLGVGTASEFTTLVGSGELKAAVTDENIVKDISFYIGSEDIRDAPAELYILVDTSGSVKVNGWYTRILRKNLNIINITGAYLSDDPTTYTPATLPLTGTEVALVEQGGTFKKVAVSEFGGGGGGGVPYKVYTALLTQTGTDAPVATVLENTLGDIVWNREGEGYYKLTFSTPFDLDKLYINGFTDYDGNNSTFLTISNFSVVNGYYTVYPLSSTVIALEFYNELFDYKDLGVALDGARLCLPEIRVYN